MKSIWTVLFSLIIGSVTYGQELNWIPFEWESDSISGKYFDKAAMNIPVSIDGLPHKFNMQFDLGAVTTVIYGNSIANYLDKYPELNSKIDTTLSFIIQSQKNPKFKDVDLRLGKMSFGKRSIGYFKNYGDTIPADSIFTNSEKHIGTIAPDLFKDKYLIIDYANNRICVTEKLPRKLTKANFQPCSIELGRVIIPLTINGKGENLMFDSGSSIFPLLSSEEKANEISTNNISDSLDLNSWGDMLKVYGKKINAEVKFDNITLPSSNVYYVKEQMFADFFKQQNIWGITGNTFFLNKMVIIDYKNNRFGIK